MLKLTDFDYNLPRELIAQYPLLERQNARLLIVERKTGKIKHVFFKDILEYLKPEDLLVLNDTKVVPARIKTKRKSGARVEIFLLKHKKDFVFEALLKPSRLKLGERLGFNETLISAQISGKNEVSFNAKNIEDIYGLGSMPLPPYIKREAEELDKVYYQTVYAKKDGAVASPTAGLHFTERLLNNIKAKGVNLAYLTLHVGLGTFKPVKSMDITKHKMDQEYFSIPECTQRFIKNAKNTSKRIIAVGTTALRALESYANGKNDGWSDLFIYPGFQFRLTDVLLTNFHLPRTTLFMLVCAFMGDSLAKRAYEEAVKQKYRFYSYGDAMLIL